MLKHCCLLLLELVIFNINRKSTSYRCVLLILGFSFSLYVPVRLGLAN